MNKKNVDIIAEAGVNHNGDEKLALKMVEAAVAAGANRIKFQTFKAQQVAGKSTPLAAYQRLNNPEVNQSQLQMLHKLELSYAAHKKIYAYCATLGIEFLSSAFDLESLAFLTKDLKLKQLKIPSGEITNAPLLLEHARTRCNLILSTGMASLAEIEAALAVLAFGYLGLPTKSPGMKNFQAAFFSDAGQQILHEKVSLLHCTTEYPAPLNEVNLRAMQTMAAAFNLPVGYSDHTLGIIAPIAAVTLGACIIEKHFTLDQSMPGPDHKASLNPKQLSDMIEHIRITEQILGNGIKGPSPAEYKNKEITRKSLVAAMKISKGEIFNSENISILRPGNGRSPFEYWQILGSHAMCDLEEGEMIK